ncbi:MAG: DUF1697 domain-containing protein [Rubrivivax sp.]
MTTPTRYVALLRGVNVGTANRVPMAAWRELLAGLGYTGARTLLNSGNAVFDVPRPARGAGVAGHIGAALVQTLGVQVPVVVKTVRELAAIVAANPLTEGAEGAEDVHPSRLLVLFAARRTTLTQLDALHTLALPCERFVIGRDAAYLHCGGGLLDSKIAKALFGAAGRGVTTRNWATTVKLLALARAAPAPPA